HACQRCRSAAPAYVFLPTLTSMFSPTGMQSYHPPRVIDEAKRGDPISDGLADLHDAARHVL
ncbi:MAG TPA: hypothetical protein VFY56_01845, partial [Propionibacteriaceae bacterium]|nr:hypothetical protein [Propionibacteriaceae bacterium]